MAMGRGSAGAAVWLVVLVFAFAVESHGARYTVGGNRGWGFGPYKQWLSSVRGFKTGDILEFRYNKAEHDAVAVNAADFRSCTLSRGYKRFSSGRDSVPLKKGMNYFICSVPGHCSAGMKIAVYAA